MSESSMDSNNGAVLDPRIKVSYLASSYIFRMIMGNIIMCTF